MLRGLVGCGVALCLSCGGSTPRPRDPSQPAQVGADADGFVTLLLAGTGARSEGVVVRPVDDTGRRYRTGPFRVELGAGAIRVAPDRFAAEIADAVACGESWVFVTRDGTLAYAPGFVATPRALTRLPGRSWRLAVDEGYTLVIDDEGRAFAGPCDAAPRALAVHGRDEVDAVRVAPSGLVASAAGRSYGSPDGGRTWHEAEPGTRVPFPPLTFRPAAPPDVTRNVIGALVHARPDLAAAWLATPEHHVRSRSGPAFAIRRWRLEAWLPGRAPVALETPNLDWYDLRAWGDRIVGSANTRRGGSGVPEEGGAAVEEPPDDVGEEGGDDEGGGGEAAEQPSCDDGWYDVALDASRVSPDRALPCGRDVWLLADGRRAVRTGDCDPHAEVRYPPDRICLIDTETGTRRTVRLPVAGYLQSAGRTRVVIRGDDGRGASLWEIGSPTTTRFAGEIELTDDDVAVVRLREEAGAPRYLVAEPPAYAPRPVRLPEGARLFGLVSAEIAVALGRTAADVWTSRDAGRSWRRRPVPIEGDASAVSLVAAVPEGSDPPRRFVCDRTGCELSGAIRVELGSTWPPGRIVGPPAQSEGSATP